MSGTDADRLAEPITLQFERADEGEWSGWVCTSPTVPGLVLSGQTFEEIGRKCDWSIPALLDAATSRPSVPPREPTAEMLKAADYADRWPGVVWRAMWDAARPSAPDPWEAFQYRVAPWMQACFGPEISDDISERCHRAYEEMTELVQERGMTRSECHQLVDYTFDRPVGDLRQEVGGVMVTVAALCLASGVDMHEAGEMELARVWSKIDIIRAKQAAKPKHSPLPEVAPGPSEADVERVARAIFEAEWSAGYDRNGSHNAGRYIEYREGLRDLLGDDRAKIFADELVRAVLSALGQAPSVTAAAAPPPTPRGSRATRR